MSINFDSKWLYLAFNIKDISMITEYMKTEHRTCDTLFSETEGAIINGNFEAAQTFFKNFLDDTLKHFKKEENILFPAFEDVTGMKQGPTQMMRQEHEQMRGLLSRLQMAMDKKDKDTFLAIAEPLMILMQQHNMKEEQMLYAMCDNTIPQDIKESTIKSMTEVTN